MTKYSCQKCNAPATVKQGTKDAPTHIERTCQCVAPIIASIQAVARGAGGVK